MNQSIMCRDLLDGLDFGNPDDIPKIAQAGITAARCPGFVAQACDILDEVLADD